MITRIGEGRLMTGMPGRGWGYICRFEMHPCCQLLLGQPVPARRVRRTHHGKSDDFPRWVQQKLDLEIKFFPAYPASAVQESLSALQHIATAYTAPAPPRPPCHKAGPSNRQESSPTGWDPGPGQRMWIGYAYLFIFKMCIELF